MDNFIGNKYELKNGLKVVYEGSIVFRVLEEKTVEEEQSLYGWSEDDFYGGTTKWLKGEMIYLDTNESIDPLDFKGGHNGSNYDVKCQLIM